ncbi:2,4-dihydroxyhept-2-ene-1,7-dioic acid aldolase [Phyllobacterium sp. 628]|uniref:HpcH/HpaI aldolase family protein n=1 Tax=Phyllobacterium sp. 628 TaxID=2718938 RepID=UPI0016626774|nr:aldolase/citrate lyase family protein [Phyllobacterium sp. 628]QND53336.1 2,4-dihydroxyhept-2-ene-1,7-dioic acid aldolase [Phyllobacterium sp. 628]
MPLASRLRAGETVFSAWCNLPYPLVLETLCKTDFTAFMLDMQHGAFDTESVLHSVGIIQNAGKHTVVRIPVDRFDMASRALDFGAEGVIAPMINSVEDARRFATSMKYPPVGERSWGQLRGRPGSYGAGGSGAYLAEVNQKTLAFAMIETREAFAALDDILAVDGIDGVFVGPSDFSIAWSNGAEVDAGSQAIIEPLKEIAAKARAAGKLCGIYAANAELAKRFTGLGFTYLPLSVDTAYLQVGAQTLLEAVKS